MPRLSFIEPSAPHPSARAAHRSRVAARVKHDGWRAQLHLDNGRARILSKRRKELSCRFRSIAAAAARLPAKSLILDAELGACDANGRPSFGELMSGAPHGCCAYIFDLMRDDSEDHTVAPLEYRRARLRKLLKRASIDALRFSDDLRTRWHCSPRARSTGWKASSRSCVKIGIGLAPTEDGQGENSAPLTAAGGRCLKSERAQQGAVMGLS